MGIVNLGVLLYCDRSHNTMTARWRLTELTAKRGNLGALPRRFGEVRKKSVRDRVRSKPEVSGFQSVSTGMQVSATEVSEVVTRLVAPLALTW